jgi:hypothetical protein
VAVPITNQTDCDDILIPTILGDVNGACGFCLVKPSFTCMHRAIAESISIAYDEVEGETLKTTGDM